jgi:hypothetical protein
MAPNFLGVRDQLRKANGMDVLILRNRDWKQSAVVFGPTEQIAARCTELSGVPQLYDRARLMLRLGLELSRNVY